MVNAKNGQCDIKCINPPQISITNNSVPQLPISKTEIAVRTIPETQVNTPYDWWPVVGLLGTLTAFAITVYLVRKATEQQIASHKETIDAGRDQAKAAILSQSRQDWINSLRDTTADFIAATMQIVDLYALNDGTKSANNALAIDSSIQNKLDWCGKMHNAKAKAVALKCKIHLLANPAETAFKEFLPLIDELYEAAADNKGKVNVLTLKVFEAAQNILKKEWERVKGLEGLGSENPATKHSAHN